MGSTMSCFTGPSGGTTRESDRGLYTETLLPRGFQGLLPGKGGTVPPSVWEPRRQKRASEAEEKQDRSPRRNLWSKATRDSQSPL